MENELPQAEDIPSELDFNQVGFDPNKVLADLALKVGTDIYKKIAASVLEVWVSNGFKKKYGFTPKPRIAKQVLSSRKDASFSTLKICVGSKHWALNSVAVGLYISQLNDSGERDEVNMIRREIKKNKGRRHLNIVHMGSTGVIKGVINHLDDLRLKGFSRISLTEEFERIIAEWDTITIFVHLNDIKTKVQYKIREKLQVRMPLFFVFSYGWEAANIAISAISEIRNNKEIEPEGYLFEGERRFDDVGTRVYMWTFEL